MHKHVNEPDEPELQMPLFKQGLDRQGLDAVQN